MSYILDALRKSEAERRQGKAPDLGQQMQVVYRPKKKPVSAMLWVALALLVNAAVLAYVFWPGQNRVPEPVPYGNLDNPQSASSEAAPVSDPELALTEPSPVSGSQRGVDATDAAKLAVRDTEPFPAEPMAQEPVVVAPAFEAPAVIVPSRSAATPENTPGLTPAMPQGRVPHLVELPLSFQKSVPDLTFNSHIFSSDPSASRVMINGHYLRQGDRFGNLVVVRITEDGVVLSKDGRYFRVGTVRDWVSPG
ncbi:hypothetical protein C7H09_17455 [Marinobacter fuscus]|uniref:Type II secretion system protein GspB C-terminal domain-containing protein n=1 Tax=Marinobacter fuscus TaxID=2109942 RepID=A0A2T1K459_9GAMM|nr:general secretion pathway protein GspB [Marinobacter fuscus]PSF04818.1 hypothetical protein C7H09_17455 [Marinobacter fuscus]